MECISISTFLRAKSVSPDDFNEKLLVSHRLGRSAAQLQEQTIEQLHQQLQLLHERNHQNGINN